MIGFWEKAEIRSPYSCWYWTAAKFRNGYGAFGIKRQAKYAHRIAYQLAKGEIPKALEVRHSCDVRHCVNPQHLSLGTRKDNMQDAVKRNRVRRGEAHVSAVLSWFQVKEARRRYADGERVCDLARLFNVKHGTLYSVIRGFNWKQE